MAARRRTTTRAAALPARRALPEVGQLLPTGRSVALGLALLVLAVGGYLAARETSLFAVTTLDVRGGTPALRAQVRAAVADETGRSLLAVDGAALARRLGALPGVRSFTYDRSFPHTLRIVIRREVPVLVVRQVPGTDAYLVAASGKVIRAVPHARLSHLPRLWLKKDARIVVGAPLGGTLAAAPPVVALARAAGLPFGVETVAAERDALTLTLRSGFQIRLGDEGDTRLKLAVARRILAVTGAAGGAGYLDVSVPARPVLAASNSQVSGGG